MSGNVKLLANRYELEKVAGRGGTSVVYKAYDLQAERAVRAIKEISKSNVDAYDTAKLESQLIKKLYEADSSNNFLPNIIHRFETEKNFYIVQDYLDGESMDYMLAAGPMPVKMFIEAAKQICQFMNFFHSTGRVHSDMKPENIMVLKSGAALMNRGTPEKNIRLKFIDFGTAIKNETGVTGYTPEYAAPEQYNESRLDERTDIYNMGATFYHMIQGRKPMRISGGNRMLTSAERFMFDKNVRADIKRIIQKCVNDDPDRRYRTCDALYKDLCRIERNSGMRLISIFAALTAVSFIGAGICAYRADSIDAKNNSELYKRNVNKGNYEAAIKIDNTNRDDIYSKLIQGYIEDSRLDMDEDNFIVNEIKSRNPIKPTDENYGQCMYEIANAYWLYYYPYEEEQAGNGKSEEEIAELNAKIELELEKSRINASYEWFEKAVESDDLEKNSPDAYKRAVIFASIGSFYANIDKMEKEGTDSQQFYSEMWENIENMDSYVEESNDVVSVRVCQTLLSFLSRYSAKFSKNGVEEERQRNILRHIEKKVYHNGEISYGNDYAKEIAESFDIEAVGMKLDMAYAD